MEKKVPGYLRNAHVRLLKHPVDRNMAWSFVAWVAFAGVSVLTGFPLVLLMGVLLGCAAGLRRLLAQGSPVRAHEALWLREAAHVSHALLYLEPGLGVEQLRELVRARVLRRFPRFTQRVVRGACGGYCWTDAREFALEEHVFEEPAVPLRALVAELMRTPLPRARPLWELRLLSGEDSGGVVVVRVHQALSDAVALVALLSNHLADGPPGMRPRRRFGAATFLLNAFRALFVAPLTFLGWLLCRRRDYNFFSRRHSPGVRCVAWRGLRFARVLRIKQVMRCSLNDVFVSAASGAVRAYFAKNGIRNPPNVTLSLPVDLRSAEEEGRVGVGFATVCCRLPSGTEGAVPRLWEVRRRMEELKTSPDTVVMWAAVATLLPLLPEALAHWIIRAVLRKATVLLSNVPGPEEPLWLGGRRLRRIVFWMSSFHSDAPLVFSLISYAGGVQLSVSADSAVVQHPQLLVDEFINELRRLSHLLARRRIPGEHRRRSHFTDERRLVEIINPPDGELQQKLQLVQEEIHCLTLQQEEPKLLERLEELKEEFSELMRELRRRKSLADGILLQDEEEEMDGELRRPRRLTLSRRSSLNALLSLASTTRPLATPTVSHHAFVVSTPNLQQSPTHPPPSSSLLQVTTQDRFGRRKSDFN